MSITNVTERDTELAMQIQAMEAQALLAKINLDHHQQRVEQLTNLVADVHKAKGRHHSQLAMCALYQACGLPFTLPTYGEKHEQMPAA